MAITLVGESEGSPDSTWNIFGEVVVSGVFMCCLQISSVCRV